MKKNNNLKLTRKLLMEYRKPTFRKAKAPVCALLQRHPCCGGVGYRLSDGGVYAKATLCDCVLNCPVCYGKMRHEKGGVSVPCRSPNPLRIVSILNDARIPARYRSAKFDTFANKTGNGEEVVTCLQDWLHSDMREGIILGGDVGVGKTFLLAALAKNLAAREKTVIFIDFFQLLNELKAGYADHQADDTILRPLIDADVLIIDELGKGRNTDWEISVLDQLVMGRYNQNKILIASTNYAFNNEHADRIRQKKAQRTEEINKDAARKLASKNLDEEDPDKKSSFRPEVEFMGDHSEKSKSNFRNDYSEDSLESRVGERIFSRLVETTQNILLTGDDFRKKDRIGSKLTLSPE